MQTLKPYTRQIPEFSDYKITSNALQQTKALIIESNVHKEPEKRFQSWFGKLRRAITIGNVGPFVELMQDTESYQGFDYLGQWKKECDGNDFLQQACLNGRVALVKHLIENGWRDKINHCNSRIEGPFLLAFYNTVMNERVETKILEVLIEQGTKLCTGDQNEARILNLMDKASQPVAEYVREVYKKQKRELNVVTVVFFAGISVKNKVSIFGNIHKNFHADVFAYL